MKQLAFKRVAIVAIRNYRETKQSRGGHACRLFVICYAFSAELAS